MTPAVPGLCFPVNPVAGKIAFIGMEVIKVVIAVIPGEPFELAAGYAFGTWEGLLLCTIGITIGSLIVFFLVKKFGMSIVRIFFKQEKIDKMFQTNYFSQLILVQLLLKKKLVNKGASIVFISSISSILGVPGTLLYASSKASVNAAVRVLASELAGQMIRVNAICPGIVKTEMLNGTNIETDIFMNQEEKYPLGLGSPEDVGNCVLFLLSRASRWLTGQCIVIDGGFTLN